MKNEEKARELAKKHMPFCGVPITECIDTALEMAEWKDQQMMELWNAARNAYEAWMGGTMNDVRECMKDLGHQIDTFLEMNKEE